MNFGGNLDKASYKLSGGNKRKLCMAIALIGNPSIMLLDEPTTGLDPKNRKEIWQIIGRITKTTKKCGVVITSHSMDEVESLATKVGIMVKGNLRCYGPVQHIKEKYGDSFEFNLKTRAPNEGEIKNIISSSGLRMDLQISSISDAKRLLEELKLRDAAMMLEKNDPNAKNITEIVFRKFITIE